MAMVLTYSSGLMRLVPTVIKADMFTILFGKLGLSDFVAIFSASYLHKETSELSVDYVSLCCAVDEF